MKKERTFGEVLADLLEEAEELEIENGIVLYVIGKREAVELAEKLME